MGLSEEQIQRQEFERQQRMRSTVSPDEYMKRLAAGRVSPYGIRNKGTSLEGGEAVKISKAASPPRIGEFLDKDKVLQSIESKQKLLQ